MPTADSDRSPRSVPTPLFVTAFGMSDPGKVRPSNEDQFLIAHLARALDVVQGSLAQATPRMGEVRGHLLLVADGVGGHRGGAQASALAVDQVERFALGTLRWSRSGVLGGLEAALRQTDDRIRDEAARYAELWGMGTTLTIACSLGDELFVAHVGDSRCYVFRGGALTQVTRDHTLVDELVRRGAVRAEDAAQHQLRHVITNVVGGNEAGVRPEVHRIALAAGDRVLLCTDGLHGSIADPAIAGILAAEVHPAQVCAHLIAAANRAGGPDNVTAVVADFSSSGPGPRAPG